MFTSRKEAQIEVSFGNKTSLCNSQTRMKPLAIISAFFSLLITVDCVYNQSFCFPKDVTFDDFDDAYVGLIISPIMSVEMIREIEIYWNNAKFQPGDTIALYTDEPTDHLKTIYTVVPDTPNGIKKTGLQAIFVPTANLTFVPQCLNYHVAWVRNGILRMKNCLQTQPRWMQERKEILKTQRLRSIFLPGTHDSASYAVYEQGKSEGFIERYTITQDVDVLAQLIYGVRYLDIRVGYYPNTETVWWANHGQIKSVPMQDIVNQVKIFLDNTNEIVIFDVQEFPVGFNNVEVHYHFVSFLWKQFAGYYLPNSWNHGWNSTLDKIWSSGRRLIIGYDQKIIDENFDLWPCVVHQWGNVRTIEDLFDHLNRIETENVGSEIIPRSAMAELTANTWDIIFNRLGGIRQMANDVNINVTYWYSSKWRYSANIVAVDFVRSSGIIETAIEWNERRFDLNCWE